MHLIIMKYLNAMFLGGIFFTCEKNKINKFKICYWQMIFIFIILKKCCSILSILFTKIILILFIEDKFSFTFLKKKKIDLKYYKLIFLIGGTDKGLHQSLM